MSALSLPEVKHMLDVLLGSLSALEELMKVARRDKDPSIVRLAVSEAETASKTCVRLSQAISAYAAEHPAEVNKNITPRRDPELDQMRQTFLGILRDVMPGREARIQHHVEALEGDWREGDYQRQRDHILAPNGDVLDLRDWFEILRRHRGLNEAEHADLRQLTGAT
ncbi:hypothetical protein [Leisingera daeponensis]|uniref:hypothetical protein n=1 Tax=Leisingera daeponensis TaxID=405746 RepID=UPI001C979F9A|nr:hypothetical protein [Leisingera daeponensis]MBY6056821.1 hypothetical protein [Leisingera daeponensis]